MNFRAHYSGAIPVRGSFSQHPVNDERFTSHGPRHHGYGLQFWCSTSLGLSFYQTRRPSLFEPLPIRAWALGTENKDQHV